MRSGIVLLLCLTLFAGLATATEVNKGKIPAEYLSGDMKTLPWKAAIWDVDEAVTAINAKDSKVLWVDTRPSTFFKHGTIKDAVLLVYDKAGSKYPNGEPVCTKESLTEAMKAAGADKVAFFCQGPKCHRSYNASYVAVQDWGFDPAQVVWFRGGYPHLFKAVSENAKLKRKPGNYLCANSLTKL